MEKGECKKIGIFIIAVFISMCLFFIQVHPLVIWDTDDWLYISYIRKAIPIWHNWNPSRVFPEIFMPMCAYLGIKCIMPITNDYIFSLMIIFGIVLSGFITIYVLSFYNLARKKMRMSIGNAIMVSILFLLLHFLIFRCGENQNTYLFYSPDVTCYFYYVIPSLLNLTLVMILESKELTFNSETKVNWLKVGGWVLLIYLAIFSNLFSSYIISIWAGSKLFYNLIINKKIKNSKNIIYILILCAWIVSAIYELSGGRAENLKDDSFINNVKQTILYLKQMVGKANRFLVLISAIFVLGGIFCFIKKKWNDYEKKNVCINIMCTILSVIFLILLSAKSQSDYIMRGDVLLGVSFFAFIILMININIIIREYKITLVIFPLLIVIAFFEIHSGPRTFAESNVSGIDSIICKNIDEDIIEQIMQAVNEGQEKMELHIPKTPGDNWPFGTYGANRFSYSLYEHGIISRPIETIMIQDVEINIKYGMNYTE